MATVYLSRRNLTTLLSKLDRVASGEESARTLVKRDTVHPKFPCSETVVVIAVEDEDYYSTRGAGDVYPADLQEKS